MRLFRIYLFFSLIFFCYVSLALASDNSEYWVTCTFSVKVNKQVKLNLLEEFRIKSDEGFYTYVQYVGMGYKINNYFDTAIWYKLVSSEKNQHWSDSHRFDIDGTLKWDINGFNLSNRSRLERNTTTSSWLYRDRIKLEKGIKLFNKSFAPYVFNEFFLDIRPNSGYHENRASVGFSTYFIRSSKLAIYYMSRAKKSKGNWSSADIIGTTVGFYF
jgi:hypothetical protein